MRNSNLTSKQPSPQFQVQSTCADRSGMEVFEGAALCDQSIEIWPHMYNTRIEKAEIFPVPKSFAFWTFCRCQTEAIRCSRTSCSYSKHCVTIYRGTNTPTVVVQPSTNLDIMLSQLCTVLRGTSDKVSSKVESSLKTRYYHKQHGRPTR
jgi:hypothetical protein